MFCDSLILFFSPVLNGLGWVICNIGILILLLNFHCNLHSIKEPDRFKISWKKLKTSSLKFVLACFVGIIFITITILLTNQLSSIIFLHIRTLLNVTIIHICIPKYYISKNQNMKLYLRVYHHQPPPVLPWQLPQNFVRNSVKLIIVSDKND